MKIRALVGSGEKIGLLLLPFAAVGLALNIAYPSAFGVGGPSDALRTISIIALVPGVSIWAWSVALILAKVPNGQLITSGPYAVVRHPLYTGVAFLVLPWAGFLLNSWLGVVLGAVLYVGSRLFSPEEERTLETTFGAAWKRYSASVMLPWL